MPFPSSSLPNHSKEAESIFRGQLEKRSQSIVLGNLAFARLVARRHATSSLQRIPERLVLGEATSKLFSDNISSLEHHGQFEWSDEVRDLPEISRGTRKKAQGLQAEAQSRSPRSQNAHLTTLAQTRKLQSQRSIDRPNPKSPK